jgi:hypothetical protein
LNPEILLGKNLGPTSNSLPQTLQPNLNPHNLERQATTPRLFKASQSGNAREEYSAFRPEARLARSHLSINPSQGSRASSTTT